MTFSFQKVQPSGLRDRKITFTTHHSVLERKHFCQLEIDHVTQKPKETCRSTWFFGLREVKIICFQELLTFSTTHTYFLGRNDFLHASTSLNYSYEQ